ncbi:MAG: hypothetical protein GX969_06555 [Firmicutes bacterium]|jgi:flagellar biosynthesis protein FlhF|nr:hypothetical protein [Bacillota bacterium]
MRIKRYTGRTINEALDAVRQGLGHDAVILHTRKMPATWLRKLLRLEKFEIIAAVDANIRKEAGESVQAFMPYPNESGEARPVYDSKKAIGTPTAPGAHFIRIHEHLLDIDVDPNFTGALIRDSRAKWKDAQLAGKTVQELILDGIAALFPTVNGISLIPGKRRVVALVGPTGVGKTTTLAKIGALFAIYGEKNVAFVTADTYRVAAMEQLRTYAEIIGVPLEVAYTPQDMREALSKHVDADLVLIDTAGRNPRSEMSMAELKAFLDAAKADEVHLVISVNTRACDLLEIVDMFTACKMNRIIFSKLDETKRLGAMLTVAHSGNMPVSYVTYGQNVPQDIRAADPTYLAKCLLDKENMYPTTTRE